MTARFVSTRDGNEASTRPLADSVSAPVFVIRLFTTAYHEECEKRRNEYKKCLQLNLACPPIDEICIFDEGSIGVLPSSDKLKIRPVSARPTYQAYFRWAEELAQDSDISIIANADIFFDSQLELFTRWKLPRNSVIALSRWDLRANGDSRLYDHNDSQDTWIFRGKPKNVYGDFPVGVARCDNRIAAEFELAGYTVLNPAFSIRSFHLHAGAPRPYIDAGHSEEIPPPYKYVWPHNLFGPLKTFLYNLSHTYNPIFWRFDRRRFSRWLPIRVVNKAVRSFKT